MARTPKRSVGKSLSVSVEGLDSFQKYANALGEAQRDVLGNATKKLGLSIASAAPGGAAGGIGRAVRTRTITDSTAIITIDHPGARPAEKGRFSRAGFGRTLRFRDGSYRKWSRQRPTRFATVGLSPRRKIITAEFKRAFDNLDVSTAAGRSA